MPTAHGLENTTRVSWSLRIVACALVAVSAIACAPPIPYLPAQATTMPPEATVPAPLATNQAPAMAAPEKRIPASDQPDRSGPARSMPFDSPAGLAAYDLAMRLGIDPEEIVVLRLEDVEFPDTELQCPPAVVDAAPGTAEETVRGQKITLAVDGQQYVYRAIGWDVALCTSEAELSDLSFLDMEAVEVDAPTQAALEALAQRIKVPADSIEVRSVESVDWPDTSLGCAEPGMMYALVITPGYRMLLQAGDEVYEVHSDLRRVVICDEALDTD